MILYLLVMLPFLALGFWAQHMVKSRFRKYAEVRTQRGMTGAEVARMILDRNGLSSVPVRAVPGELSDHYDPRDRSVNLSEGVFAERSISASAVAAHEVGHALQHQASYSFFKFRSALAPVAQLGSSAFSTLFMIGIVLTIFAQQPGIGTAAIQLGILFFSLAVLFHIVTLPVEFDASRRAKRQLVDMGMVSDIEAGGTAKVLSAAAMTYVVGALTAVAQIIYFVMMYFGVDD